MTNKQGESNKTEGLEIFVKLNKQGKGVRYFNIFVNILKYPKKIEKLISIAPVERVLPWCGRNVYSTFFDSQFHFPPI